MEGLGEAIAIILIFYSIVFILALAVKISSRWVFFNKCGEQGWKSLIPIYDEITILKISGLSYLWLLAYAGYAIFVLTYFVVLMGISFDTGGNIDASPLIAMFNIINMLLSLIYMFVRFNIGYNLSKKFNESIGYAFLIMFFEPIMFYVLGLSKSYTYDENAVVSSGGVFGNNTNTTSSSYCGNCGTVITTQDVYCKECGNKVR